MFEYLKRRLYGYKLDVAAQVGESVIGAMICMQCHTGQARVASRDALLERIDQHSSLVTPGISCQTDCVSQQHTCCLHGYILYTQVVTAQHSTGQ